MNLERDSFEWFEEIARRINTLAGRDVAAATHSGGGIFGISVSSSVFDYFWGTANDTWGADVSHKDDDYFTSVDVSLSSETDDLDEVAKVIWEESK